jgi:trk system potassium uptake protein TrkA
MEEMVYHSEVRTVYSTGNGEVEIYEFTIPTSWDGHKISEVVPSSDCVIVSLSRAGVASLASKDDFVREGDILHISATFEGAEAMRVRVHSAQEVKK